MTPHHAPDPDELDAWLDRLTDLSPEARRALLDAECADPAMRAALESSRAAREADHPMTLRAEEALRELVGVANQ